MVANFNPPTEKLSEETEDGSTQVVIKEGKAVLDKLIEIPKGYKLVSEYKLPENSIEFDERELEAIENTLYFEKLEPSEYRIYKLIH